MNADENLEQLANEVANFALQEPNQEVSLQNLPNDILISILEKAEVSPDTVREALDALETSTSRRDFLNRLDEDLLEDMYEQLDNLLDFGEDTTEFEEQIRDAEENLEDIEFYRARGQEDVDEDTRIYLETSNYLRNNINLMNWMRQVMRFIKAVFIKAPALLS